MVSSRIKSQLFSEDRIKKYEKEGCRLVYGILGAMPGNYEDRDFSTMALALSPGAAYKKCKELMGDVIEVWLVRKDYALESEKWDPEYFRKHFLDHIHLDYSDKEKDAEFEDSDENEGEDEDDEDEDNENEDEESANDSDSDEQDDSNNDNPVISTPQSLLNCAMIEMLEAQEMIMRMTANASFGTGRPIDIENLLTELQNHVAKIIYALSFAKPGFAPKFKEGPHGSQIPYWTAAQIKKAHIDPDNA